MEMVALAPYLPTPPLLTHKHSSCRVCRGGGGAASQRREDAEEVLCMRFSRGGLKGLLRRKRWFSRQSYAVSVVPRYTQERVSDSPVQTLRSSFLLSPNASATSTIASSWPSLHGQPCTGSSTRRISMLRLSGRGTAPPRSHYSRSIVGASLDVIQKKRAEKPEVCDAAREAALREIKEHIKKTKDEKKGKKAETAKSQKTAGKANAPKPSKGPKLGGGGGKR